MSIDLGLQGTACIVTGGTRGIGRAVVELLLAQGASVMAVGSQPETTKRLRNELAAHRETLDVIEQDMRNDDCGTRLVDRAIERFGRIDIVVNNASAFEYKPANEIVRDDWRNLFELKLLGYWALARAATAELEKRKGAITNVSGVAGVIASSETFHVGAINAGIISLSESLAKALAPRGVRVNTVSPGGTNTDRFATRAQLIADAKGIAVEAVKQDMGAAIPVGFPADPHEIATIIAMLSSPLFRSVTGAHIVIDGGATLGSRRRV